ncbi:hypothetical protein AB0B44_34955, partial [Streptomyces sp. NPDC041003]
RTRASGEHWQQATATPPETAVNSACAPAPAADRRRSRCCAAGAGGRRSVGRAREYGREARLGPLTEGLDVPRDLDLGNRPRALKELRVQPAAHSRMVSTAREVPPEREAGLLIGSRQWPLLAVRMQQICEDGGLDVIAAHLARPSTDTAWKKATGATVPGRIVDANLAP